MSILKKCFFSFALLVLTIIETKASSAWNQKAHFGGVGRHRGTGLCIGNRGYMGLGHYNGAGPNVLFQDWWEFDPSSNTWTQKANYPFPSYAAASFAIGTKGYVGTGVSAGNNFYAFDPIANTWTAIQPVPLGTTDQVGFSVNGKGYYLYGTQLYEYNADLNTWTTKAPVPFSPSSWCSSFTIGEKAYIKSGLSLYEYKSTTDEWTVRAIFPGLATGGAAAFAVKGKGYIVTGYIGWLSELSGEVWEFDPATNTWNQLDDFPGANRRFSSGFAIGDKGYVGIGTTGTNMRDFWEFDELLELDSEQELHVKVYPNPASEYCIVDGMKSGDYAIINSSGCKLISGKIDGVTTVDISNLSAGIYFIELSERNMRRVQTIVIE
ncbi:MAG: T9SS type A sorting domain-containing protein [Crocinitomicaceae bacterium]|nr:T9SS type A sorting domain-containing protein [Crocinitomicaceae bacterium]